MNRVLSIVIALSWATLAVGQHAEIGIFAGGSYYLGELNPKVHVLSIHKPSFGIMYRQNINKRYSLKFQGSYNRLSGNDADGTLDFNNWRDQYFSTTLWDITGQLEFNFLPYKIGDSDNPFTPYVFIGASYFRANPQSGSNKVEPPSEKADNKMYRPAVPFGLGFRVNLTKQLGINLEWGMRKTFTDKLDGIGSRYSNGYHKSNISTNDWYSIMLLSLNYRFKSKGERCPSVGRKTY